MPCARALSVCLALSLLASCRAPPLHDTPEPLVTTHALRLEPLRAAACIARNVDRYRTPYSARIRPGEAPAIAEVLVGAGETVLAVQLLYAGEGSSAIVRRTPQRAAEIDDLVAAAIAGC